VVRWFLDADDNPGSFTMFLEICMQIYSVIFALSQQINKQKVCENNESPLRR